MQNRMPTHLIARLMLALLLICNLTFCLSWHGVSAQSESSAVAACHTGATSDVAAADCPMPSALAGTLNQLAAGLPWLLLPLLLCLTLFAPPLRCGVVLRLRDGRERGAPPPSWPRRHLELCILRN